MSGGASTASAAAALTGQVSAVSARLDGYCQVNPATGELRLFAPDGSTQFAAGNQPGAVTYFMSQGGVSGSGPVLVPKGAAADIPSYFAAKGLSPLWFGNGAGTLFKVAVPAGAASTWPVVLAGTSSIAYFTAESATNTNLSVCLLPVGNGGSSAGPGHTTSGTNSFAAGRFCTTSGYASIALGNDCLADGIYSFATGNRSWTHAIDGIRVHGYANLGAARGTTQVFELPLAVQGTGSSALVATSNGGALAAGNSLVVQNNETIAFGLLIVGQDTISGARASWVIDGMVHRGASASTITLDGSSGTGAPKYSSGSGASTWTVALGVDTTKGCLTVTCTGSGSNTLRWSCRLHGVEVING